MNTSSATPLVSVIIPVYNVEEYLSQCLDSVVCQSLEDIEIICLDDGSTDNSGRILDTYSWNDKRIRVIHKKNEGVGPARNDGIKLAKGEFVCFMDPDDVYPTSDILQILYTSAKENNVLICGGEFSDLEFRDFKDGDILFRQENYQEFYPGYTFSEDSLINYSDYQFDYGYHRFIYNRTLLVGNNIYFPNYKRFQDPPFFVNAMIHAKVFYALHKITYGYRCGHYQITWNQEKIDGLLQGVTDNINYAKQYHFDKLLHYSYTRLIQHYPQIKQELTKNQRKTVKKILLEAERKFRDLKDILKEYKEESLHCSCSFPELIFSVKNSNDRNYKIITILGYQIAIQKGHA